MQQGLATYIKKLEQELVNIIIRSLREGKLKEEDLPKIADYILKHIDRIQTQDEIVGFLGELSLHWTVFSPIATVEESRLKSLWEKKAASEILQLISTGEVNKAISVAKEVLGS